MNKLSNPPAWGNDLSKNNRDNPKIGPDVTVLGTPIIPCPFANWCNADGRLQQLLAKRRGQPTTIARPKAQWERFRVWTDGGAS